LIFINGHRFSTENFLWFVPMIVNAVILQLTFVYTRPRIGTIVAHGVAYWSYIFTIIGILFGHREGWKATGAKSKVSKGFLIISSMINIYLIGYLAVVTYLIYNNKLALREYNIYPIFGWVIINIVYNLIGWSYVSKYLKDNYLQAQAGKVGRRFFYLQKLLLTLVIMSLLYIVCDRFTNMELSTRLTSVTRQIIDLPVNGQSNNKLDNISK
jgi:hypothetical protein